MVDILPTLVVVIVSWVYAYVKITKLYSLNMSSLLYFNYILTKLLKTEAKVYNYSISLDIKELIGNDNLKALAI